MLVKSGSRDVAIVPFPLLVEIVYKTHNKVAHIGRHKLIELIGQHFWHPSLDEVARDVCASCIHCQLYKCSSQPICPPTIKIQSRCPFDLVAMDLIQFQKSRKGNVGALVIVDHFSKLLNVIQIKNKKAETVANALLDRGLPHMLKIPNRILTDNGPEFRSDVFNSLLSRFNIKHVYSTRYRAQGNGCVERCNRTITEFLKGLIDGEQNNWDKKLPEPLWRITTPFTPKLKLVHRSIY
jgi:transposase InsO family protein